MAKFRLIAGQHQGPDHRQDPVQEEYVDAETGEPRTRDKMERYRCRKTGKTKSRPRMPTRTYVPGEIVEDDRDLAALFGADKFQLVSGTPEPCNPLNLTAAAFAGGQVAGGFQKTGGRGPNGELVSGPVDLSDPDQAALIPDAPDYEGKDDARAKREGQEHAERPRAVKPARAKARKDD